MAVATSPRLKLMSPSSSSPILTDSPSTVVYGRLIVIVFRASLKTVKLMPGNNSSTAVKFSGVGMVTLYYEKSTVWLII